MLVESELLIENKNSKWEIHATTLQMENFRDIFFLDILYLQPLI
jgi:hypothetical protein